VLLKNKKNVEDEGGDKVEELGKKGGHTKNKYYQS
jgi:hypothetical protein